MERARGSVWQSGWQADGGWRSLAAIYLATVLVRGATAFFIRQPGFTDSFYYYDVASNLYAGRGFVEDFVWNYLEAPPGVTHPSNTYWGPLASLLVLPSFWLFGPSFRAAQVPMVLLSAVLPVLSYLTARYLLGSHRQGLIAAALTMLSGVYLAYWTVPEGYVPFAIAGAVALMAMARGLGGNWRWSAVAGGAIAVAQLARSDGALFLVVLLALWGYAIWRRPAGSSAVGLALQPLLACGVYTLVMAPWLYRNWLELGSPLFNPGAQTLFLRDYDEVFTFGGQLDLRYYLAWGWAAILGSKLHAVGQNLHVVAKALSYYLVPLAGIGLWGMRRERRAQPFLVYGIALYAVMTFAFTLPGQLGSLLHSLAALLPFLMSATALGLDRAIGALVRHRRHLDPATAQRVCTFALVFAQATLTLGLGIIAAREWETRYSYALYPQAASWLGPQLAAGEPVMILDPPAYAYFSGRPAIAVPNNEPGTVVEVARRYGVRFILLEPAHMQPVDRIYRGEESDPQLALRLSLRNERGQELKIYELD